MPFPVISQPSQVTIGDTDIDTAEYFLGEEWTYSTFVGVQYLAVTRNADPVFQEQQNKVYTLLATFNAKIELSPGQEEMMEYGVTWEDGTILVITPRKFLAEAICKVTSTGFSTLDAELRYDDVIQFPGINNADGAIERYRIFKILRNGWFGNTPMMVTLFAKALPAQNQ